MNELSNAAARHRRCQSRRQLLPVLWRAGSARSRSSGKLLKFSKGDYLVGEDNDEVEEGTQYVANMDELMVGWIRWADGKPEDQIMGRVSEGYQPPKRNTLGDDDKTSGKWTSRAASAIRGSSPTT
jgi:hypothetical protein